MPLLSIQSARACGMFSLVMMKLNSTALVMMYSSMALMLAEFSSTLGVFQAHVL